MSAELTDPFQFDLGGTLKDALGGSLNGAVVMVMQVLALMPLHTIMNHQYRYGGAPPQATKTLFADGGWTRFYQGLAAALVQGPVSRFCDAVASVGVLALLKGNKYTRDLPALAQVIFVSLTAPACRMVLTPIDTVKTAMHTDGRAGLAILHSRVRAQAPCLALALASSSIETASTDQALRHRHTVVWSSRGHCRDVRRTFRVVWDVQLERPERGPPPGAHKDPGSEAAPPRVRRVLRVRGVRLGLELLVRCEDLPAGA